MSAADLERLKKELEEKLAAAEEARLVYRQAVAEDAALSLSGVLCGNDEIVETLSKTGEEGVAAIAEAILAQWDSILQRAGVASEAPGFEESEPESKASQTEESSGEPAAVAISADEAPTAEDAAKALEKDTSSETEASVREAFEDILSSERTRPETESEKTEDADAASEEKASVLEAFEDIFTTERNRSVVVFPAVQDEANANASEPQTSELTADGAAVPDQAGVQALDAQMADAAAPAPDKSEEAAPPQPLSDQTTDFEKDIVGILNTIGGFLDDIETAVAGIDPADAEASQAAPAQQASAPVLAFVPDAKEAQPALATASGEEAASVFGADHGADAVTCETPEASAAAEKAPETTDEEPVFAPVLGIETAPADVTAKEASVTAAQAQAEEPERPTEASVLTPAPVEETASEGTEQAESADEAETAEEELKAAVEEPAPVAETASATDTPKEETATDEEPVSPGSTSTLKVAAVPDSPASVDMSALFGNIHAAREGIGTRSSEMESFLNSRLDALHSENASREAVVNSTPLTGENDKKDGSSPDGEGKGTEAEPHETPAEASTAEADANPKNRRPVFFGLLVLLLVAAAALTLLVTVGRQTRVGSALRERVDSVSAAVLAGSRTGGMSAAAGASGEDGTILTESDTLIGRAILQKAGLGANIAEIREAPELRFNVEKDYGVEGILDAITFDDDLWYINDVTENVHYTPELVGTVISYYSRLNDRMNYDSDDVLRMIVPKTKLLGDVTAIKSDPVIRHSFDLLEIGEIRRADKNFYVMLRLSESTNDDTPAKITTKVMRILTSEKDAAVAEIADVR